MQRIKNLIELQKESNKKKRNLRFRKSVIKTPVELETLETDRSFAHTNLNLRKETEASSQRMSIADKRG